MQGVWSSEIRVSACSLQRVAGNGMTEYVECAARAWLCLPAGLCCAEDLHPSVPGESSLRLESPPPPQKKKKKKQKAKEGTYQITLRTLCEDLGGLGTLAQSSHVTVLVGSPVMQHLQHDEEKWMQRQLHAEDAFSLKLDGINQTLKRFFPKVLYDFFISTSPEE